MAELDYVIHIKALDHRKVRCLYCGDETLVALAAVHALLCTEAPRAQKEEPCPQ